MLILWVLVCKFQKNLQVKVSKDKIYKTQQVVYEEDFERQFIII